MDGFMGEANQAESVQEQPKEQTTEQAEQLTVLTDKQESPKAVSSKTATKKDANETETTEKMKSRLEAKRRENVGRPKKGETAKSTKKPQEIRATFIVDPDLLQKVKYISLVEGALLKDVISEAWELRFINYLYSSDLPDNAFVLKIGAICRKQDTI